MKTIIIAAIARNGVIGRTSRSCEVCDVGFNGRDHAVFDCAVCNRSRRVPCNDVPWSYPEDMKHFKDMTMGHAVVMGRKTWESLPERCRPLPGRTNVVVSKAMSERTMRGIPWWYVPDLEAAQYVVRKHEKLYVIGGAQLYAAALPLADELDLTLIDKDYEGDVYFPTRQLALDTAKSFGWDEPNGGYRNFDCVERRPGTTPELTFTKWVRR